jgi:SAM-dependent methyltransferase
VGDVTSVGRTGFLDRYPADLGEWADDERLTRRGFVHGWRSRVAPGNGETFFDALVRSHLRPESVVADIGCGHGGYARTLAAHCQWVTGIDGDPAVIELARELATERGVANVDFRALRLDAGGGVQDAGVGGTAGNGDPAGGVADASVDVFVCRRGPVLAKWLGLALRAARPGAVAVGMHPTGAAGAVPPWNAELPPSLRIDRTCGYDEVRGWVTSGIDLAPGRITLDGCWWLDVAEYFDEPAELYARLAGRRMDVPPSSGVPPWPDVKGALTRLFEVRGGTLELRHCRLVWKASFR